MHANDGRAGARHLADALCQPRLEHSFPYSRLLPMEEPILTAYGEIQQPFPKDKGLPFNKPATPYREIEFDHVEKMDSVR